MGWLMLHAAFGQIAQGAGAYPDNDRPSSAAAQMGTVAHALGGAKVDEAVAAWFDSTWAELTKTRDLKARTHLFIEFALPGSVRLWLWKKALAETKADGATIKRMHPLFLQKAADALAAQFVADLDRGLETWREVLTSHFKALRNEELKQFRQDIDSVLLDAYIARAAVELEKPRSQLKDYVEAVREIIRIHNGTYIGTFREGVNAWNVPSPPPDRWSMILSSEGAGFLSGAILLPFAAAAAPVSIIVAAGVLLAAEKAGTLYLAWEDLKDKETDFRNALAKERLKTALREVSEIVVELVDELQDQFAVIFTVEGVKAGLNFETEATAPIRTYVWRQLFKDFPQDRTEGRQKLTQSLEADFKKLSGA